MSSSPFMTLALTGGDWVIWALVAASVFAVSIVVDRFKLLKAERAALAALRPALTPALAEGDLAAAGKAVEKHPCAASRALTAALGQAGRGPDAAADHLAAALSEEKLRLEGRMLWLGTLGNNAPFIGLFGTVLGVIKAFNDLAQSGAGPEVVMAGLSEALIATAVGLLVALPCVLAYNALQKATRDLLVETEALGRRVVSAARERRR
ncbi:MAG: MotA/TolQ/ExbB proton channel family protein [Elusimicrobiota bacterium]|nr:MotA/TolQ/ExbB proton channel family protein [Elusimicrobiota bacterium]